MRQRELERIRQAERDEAERQLKARHEAEDAAMNAAGGFTLALSDRYPPVVCTYCGCSVIHRLAAKHRERCAE